MEQDFLFFVCTYKPATDNNAAVMDSNIELYTGIGVVLVLLVAVMLTIAAIFALRCKQQKKR